MAFIGCARFVDGTNWQGSHGSAVSVLGTLLQLYCIFSAESFDKRMLKIGYHFGEVTDKNSGAFLTHISSGLCLVCMPSVLLSWSCVRKSIRPVENWVARCWRGYLSAARCRWSIWSSGCHCHPVISCFIKIHIGLIFLGAGWPRLSWKTGS